jgi:hypothetical protein
MRHWRWQFGLGLLLLVLSGALAAIHYALFHDAKTLEFYLFLDLVFIPVQVLVVTLIIDNLLTNREKNAMLKKLNMAIGAFFSEVGIALLKQSAGFAAAPAGSGADLAVTKNWSKARFAAARSAIMAQEIKLDSRLGDLAGLRAFLSSRRSFLLGLLQNPNLLEHESFTELLWAVFHLLEELAHRADFQALPGPDYDHLSGDLERAYRLLIVAWLDYLRHLQQSYPYLFSLAARLNPFDPAATVELR